jgi:hypothetical protein
MSTRGRIRVWATPIVLGVLTSFGLISALVSDDAGDVLAWLTVGAPVAVVLWCLRWRAQGERQDSRDTPISSASGYAGSD